MAQVVVFGLRDFASLAHYYLKHDSPHDVVAFTVHREFVPEDPVFEGLPVVPLEELPQRHSPSKVACFAPMSHRGMNRNRESVYNELKENGYTLISYVSSRATLFPESPVGDNCFILEDNTIQPFVQIGDNVVLWSGNHIGHHSRIGDHVFCSSHVVVSGHCTVEPYAFLGVNATVKDGVRIREGTLVGMGAVIAADTDPWTVYKPNSTKPARIKSTELFF